MIHFLNRTQELARLRRRFHSNRSTLVCLYGRRRCGKTRLLREVMKDLPHVYFTADEREAELQRSALAKEIGRLIPGFDRVSYPGWDDLFVRWFSEAKKGQVLVLDEFPYMVQQSPELPSLLQKRIDERAGKNHLVLLGSSQRMMMGLLLDDSAPLYGRADEIIKVQPLAMTEARHAFRTSQLHAFEHYAIWGGVPRYWELAREYDDLWKAIESLVLDPNGILHSEPLRLLSDDLSDLAQASSILGLIGNGCHRLSEIAGRIGKPSTALTRPIARLIEMGLVRRETPFGTPEKESKRSIYRIDDPFLRFWYRYVLPNRSRLAAGEIRRVSEEVQNDVAHHFGSIWEDLVRGSVAQRKWFDIEWTNAARYWGPLDGGGQGELDLVASNINDRNIALIAEVKVSCQAREVEPLLTKLIEIGRRCPHLKNKELKPCLFVLRPPGGKARSNVFSLKDVC